jgi:hypothetical protein
METLPPSRVMKKAIGAIVLVVAFAVLVWMLSAWRFGESRVDTPALASTIAPARDDSLPATEARSPAAEEDEPRASWVTTGLGQQMLKVETPGGEVDEVFILLEPVPMKAAGSLWPQEEALMRTSEAEVSALQALTRELAINVRRAQVETATINWISETAFTMEIQLDEAFSVKMEADALARLTALLGEDRALLFLEGTETGMGFAKSLAMYGRDRIKRTIDLNGPETPIGRQIAIKNEILRIHPTMGVPMGFTTSGPVFAKDVDINFPGMMAAAEKAKPKD